MVLRRVRSLGCAVLGAALLAVAPCVSVAAQPSHPSAEKSRTVVIEGLHYRPGVVVARVGEPVKWVNKDLVPHTVTAVDGSFDSQSIAPGSSWTYVPHKAGEYHYVCAFHATMKGVLEVR